MIRNYFKIGLRNLFRQKAYSFFNLFGLALGISCALLLTLHIKEEMGYEKNFSDYANIYRVVSNEWSKTSPPMSYEMQEFFPEVKSICRFAEGGRDVVNFDGEKNFECTSLFADSSVVDMFDLKSVIGNPKDALSDPTGIVITRSTSGKFFGKGNPINKKLNFNGKDDYFVRAVVEDLPDNTHLNFDILFSMRKFYQEVPRNWLENKGWMFGWTYVQFNNEAAHNKALARFSDFWLKFKAEDPNRKEVMEEAAQMRFQPITDIHLKSNLIQEMGPNSNVLYVYILIAVEFLILVIACINFINLFTTQALKRMKEVAVRKVLGAQKSQLIAQFLFEAFILTILAGVLALVIYQVAMPFYNSIAGKSVSWTAIFTPGNLTILAAIILFTGLASGLFPALFISNFHPAESLKSTKTPRSSANYLRKGLVVFQFVVAGFLIISTILIYQQIRLFHNTELGFNKDQVMVVNMYGKFYKQLTDHPELIKSELLVNPNIIEVGRSSNVIGDDLSVESVTPVNAVPNKEYPTVRVYRVDEHYIDLLGINLKEGRNFSRSFNDSASFILNEKAVQALEIKDPLNASIINNTRNLQGKIVGVMKDFHFTSLHNQIEPLVLEFKPEWAGNMLVKIRPTNIEATIAFLKSKFNKIAPGTLFSYGFLDERISGLYKKEDNMSQVLKIFAVLSIMISCLGLFGLAAYAAETRTKEIGIRKVIGAGVGNLVTLMSKDFVVLVLLGNIIAWPLAWYAMHKWLQAFTYRIEIGWGVFAISFVLTLLIAMVTISYHCIKTAVANPVNSLRTE
jgi:putative ABC transport system permease protein